MALANNKTKCFICNEKKITYCCEGCSKRFCLIHLTEHRQILNKEFKRLINDCEQFKQRINKPKQNRQYLQNQLLIKQIDQWERNSIEKIKQKAQETRKIIHDSSELFINEIQMKFNDLSQQIKYMEKENEFNEINLEYLRNQLKEITEELNNSSNISIKEDSQSFVNEISIISSKKSKFNEWIPNGIAVAGGNGQGQKLNQLYNPNGIFLDKNKNIFIVDCFNHRIVEWKYNAKEGQIIAGENKQGIRMNQLTYPTDVIFDQQNHSIIIADQGNRRVIQWLNHNQQILIHSNISCLGLAMDKYGFLYVSDHIKNEVRRWKMGEYKSEGIVVAGGNGEGNKLNQLHGPGFISIDNDQSIYVSDCGNHRVMKWRKDQNEGIIVAGGNGQGANLNQLSSPKGVIVDNLGQIYVADMWNNRVMRWCEEKEEGELIVGGNGEGNQSNQLFCPYGLSFDDEGNLYVAEARNHRITKFEIIL
ncbi:unnamed protein product [Adineta steineri]|uniref:Uncharacterized protein n=1 Tax=Adineta steineri TaxID=433720 RepID=A0A818XXK6_9BILA|nr:unnamed protein product [Adineta steineri]CAF3746648.1 unnamed protein product [Adineta steineri]